MRLVIYGPPGAGKGTQAAKLVGKFNIAHLSTGDILRDAVARGTKLGKKAYTYMEAGNLVPSEILNGIVEEKLYEAKYFLLDGYPRTVEQAEFLDSLNGLEINAIIFIEVPEEVLLKRLTGRRTCNKCKRIYSLYTDSDITEGGTKCPVCGGDLVQRADDIRETVMKRLEIYRENTEPVLNYYKKNGLLFKVDGNKTPERVYQDILQLIDTNGLDSH